MSKTPCLKKTKMNSAKFWMQPFFIKYERSNRSLILKLAAVSTLVLNVSQFVADPRSTRIRKLISCMY